MGWKEYNGGDDVRWLHIVLLFLIFIGMILFFWLFGPESRELVESPIED